MGKVLRFNFVQSKSAPAETGLYDENWELWGPQIAEESGITEEEALEAIKESRVWIKIRRGSGDDAFITARTYDSHLTASEKNPLLQEMQTKFNVEMSSLATAAAVITRTEGPLFYDSEANRQLEFSGDYEDRLEAVYKLPFPVIAFVEAESNKRAMPPLPVEKPEKHKKRDTGQPSTTD